VTVLKKFIQMTQKRNINNVSIISEIDRRNYEFNSLLIVWVDTVGTHLYNSTNT